MSLALDRWVFSQDEDPAGISGASMATCGHVAR